MKKYYVENMDGAVVINHTLEIEKGDTLGILVNEALCFYKVKKVTDKLLPKSYPVKEKIKEELEVASENKVKYHEFSNEDDTEIKTYLLNDFINEEQVTFSTKEALTRGQKITKGKKLYQIKKINNKEFTIEVEVLEFKMVNNVPYKSVLSF